MNNEHNNEFNRPFANLFANGRSLKSFFKETTLKCILTSIFGLSAEVSRSGNQHKAMTIAMVSKQNMIF